MWVSGKKWRDLNDRVDSLQKSVYDISRATGICVRGDGTMFAFNVHHADSVPVNEVVLALAERAGLQGIPRTCGPSIK